ncbi:MAG: alpha-amylase family glycosyl hydrolase [Bryobacteraceae bacterium]
MIKQSSRHWWTDAIFYQVYLPSFADSNGDGIGDLPGLIERLDHIRPAVPDRPDHPRNRARRDSLNADALWITPFYPSSGWDGGYDISDYTAVDSVYGMLADLDRLLNECHRRGLRVVIDWVPNHTGDQHPWFQESKSSRNNSKRDWYVWRDGIDSYTPPNNWRSFMPPVGSAWTYDRRTGQFYLHSFSSHQPDLNWDNPAVRSAMHDTLRFWLDRGVDGFRVDSLPFLGKDPQLADNEDPASPWGEHNLDWPSVHSRIRELRSVVSGYGDIALIGEVNLPSFASVLKYVGDDELCLAQNFGLVSLEWCAQRFKDALSSYGAASEGNVWPAWYLNSHDHSRSVTRYDDASGNGEQRARAGAVLLLTLACTPFLYQGEELGLADVPIPASLARDVIGRDPQRTPFPWEPPELRDVSSAGTPWLPLGSQARVKNRFSEDQEPNSFLNLYRNLIQVRQASPALTYGSLDLLDSASHVLAYRRSAEEQHIVVAINFSGEPQEIKLPDSHALSLLVNSFLDQQTEFGSNGYVHLRPNEAIVFEIVSPLNNTEGTDMSDDIGLRYAEAIRNMINNETGMVANRMNWMFVLQGLLFTAAGNLQKHSLLIGVLAVLGIGVSVSIRREILFSERAIRQILDRWNRFKETRTPEQLAVMPPAFVGGESTEGSKLDHWLAARRLLPVLFTLSWLAVAAIIAVKR